jgi:hypothetical protein
MSRKFSPSGHGIFCSSDGTWSIFRDIGEDHQWWCGDNYEWVSPYSDYWQFAQDCWNESFKSSTEAMNKLKELLS